MQIWSNVGRISHTILRSCFDIDCHCLSCALFILVWSCGRTFLVWLIPHPLFVMPYKSRGDCGCQMRLMKLMVDCGHFCVPHLSSCVVSAHFSPGCCLVVTAMGFRCPPARVSVRTVSIVPLEEKPWSSVYVRWEKDGRTSRS